LNTGNITGIITMMIITTETTIMTTITAIINFKQAIMKYFKILAVAGLTLVTFASQAQVRHHRYRHHFKHHRHVRHHYRH